MGIADKTPTEPVIKRGGCFTIPISFAPRWWELRKRYRRWRKRRQIKKIGPFTSFEMPIIKDRPYPKLTAELICSVQPRKPGNHND